MVDSNTLLLRCTDGSELRLALSPGGSTVSDVKARVEAERGHPAHLQRLIHLGRVLEDSEAAVRSLCLSEYAPV